MLASAAAGSVLENWRRCSFPFLRNVLFLSFLLSGRDPLLDDSLCSDSNGPDEAQQFTSNCHGDLSLVLAGCCRSHVTLVQPVLRLPCNLFSLFGNTLLSFAQGRTRCMGDDDSSTQLRRRFVANARCLVW